MSRSISPFDQPSTTPTSNLGHRLLLALAVLVFAVAAAYGALVLVTRIDELLFPGNGIDLGVKLPLVDSGSGEDVGRERINFLVMGLDRRPNEGEGPSRSDTMFVLTIDPQGKTAGILGIPRDLYVEIPDGEGGYFEDRINTAFIFGELNDYENGGRGLAVDTVERNFNINIHHYVVVDFEGFEEIIDALGGIDVDVPTYIYDPEYSRTEDPGDYDPQEFEAGAQHMDGGRALAYARIRRGYCEPAPCTIDDLDRIQRQQRIIFAVMDKALNLDVLPNAIELWEKYKDAVETDINDFQIAGYARLAADIPSDKISALSLGPATTNWMTPAGAAVLLPSKEGIQRIVQALFTDQQLLEEQAIIEVVDGTSEPEDMAAKAVGLLKNLGFPEETLISSVPTDGSLFAETLIVDFSNQSKSYTVEKLCEWLKVPPQRVRQATAADDALRTSEADIVVVLGSDVDISNLEPTPED